VSEIVITRDGRAYVYSYGQRDTQLYVATGLK